MTYLKKYGLRLLYTILSIVLSLLILTALYYFNIISNNTYKILKVVLIFLNIFIGSYILGKSSEKKGYLEGLKFSLIIIPVFIITTLLTGQSLQMKSVIYYVIIASSSILGSMVGISRKKES